MAEKTFAEKSCCAALRTFGMMREGGTPHRGLPAARFARCGPLYFSNAALAAVRFFMRMFSISTKMEKAMAK